MSPTLSLDALGATPDQLADPAHPFGRALTRKAWVLENRGVVSPGDHHERLEFLGDAWLGAVVSEILTARFPDADEGQLTPTRSEVVDTPTLAAVFDALDLAPHLRVGKGELGQAQHLTSKSKADHVEALIGAAAVVGGVERVRAVVEAWWEGRWPAEPVAVRDDNDVTRLQELVLKAERRPGSEPKYTFEPVDGRPGWFVATVVFFLGGEEHRYSGAACLGKQAAKQSAAAVALRALGDQPE